MHFESLIGKCVQLGRARPGLWRPFITGWLYRNRNGFAPCIVPNCEKFLKVPLEDFYASYQFFYERLQGRRELDYFLGKLGSHETLYDVGAFRGAYSATAKLKLRENISIHAFEPLMKNVEAIHHICALNQFEDFKINPLAVGDGSSLTGGLNEQDVMFRLGDSKAATAVEFPAVSLDEYIKRGAPPPTIVKIDVDGFELLVLHGGRGCLKQHHPRIWLEVHPEFLEAQKKSPDEVLDVLRKIGYKISLFDDFNSPNSRFSYHIWCD